MSKENGTTIKILLFLILLALVDRGEMLSTLKGWAAFALIAGLLLGAGWLAWHVGRMLFVHLPVEVAKEGRRSLGELAAARREGRPWIPKSVIVVGLVFALAGTIGLIAYKLGAPRWVGRSALWAFMVWGVAVVLWGTLSAADWVRLNYREIPSIVMETSSRLLRRWASGLVGPVTMPAKLIGYYRWQKSVGQFPGYLPAAGDFALSMYQALLVAFLCFVPLAVLALTVFVLVKIHL